MDPLKLFDSSTQLLQKSLDLRSANQNVIAANIANAETPGYDAARFEFAEELKQALTHTGMSLSTTHVSHIPVGAQNVEQVSGTIVKTSDSTGIGDQNGISVDEEMLALSENQLMYETAARLLKKKLAMLKYVVQGQ